MADTKEYVYNVMLRTEDYRMYRDTTEISSSWPTYRDARESAKFELSQWDRDFWEEYDVTPEGADEYDSDDEECDSDGNERVKTKFYDISEGFRIEASSSEGETFTVWIEKKEAPAKAADAVSSTVESASGVVPKAPTSATSAVPDVASVAAAVAEKSPPKITLPPIASLDQRPSPADALLSASSFAKPSSSSITTTKRPTGNPHHKAVYKVMQWEQDNHNGGAETTTTKSTWDTYEKAKNAARRVLLDQYERKWFEHYQEEDTADESGGFEVWARCPEGEVMRIYVDEQPIIAAPHTPVTKALYTIVSKTEDAEGLCQDIVFESLADANKMARTLLVYDLSANQYPAPKENEEQHQDKTAKTLRNFKEQNRGSVTKPYNGSTDDISVEVRIMKVMPSKASAKASNSTWSDGTSKKRSQPIQDIGDRPGKKQKPARVQEESDDEIIWL
jgi:hypothetical protein